jgi:SAM-dependent methyltransferase
MGIDAFSLDFLLDFKSSPGGLGDALTLGRQWLHIDLGSPEAKTVFGGHGIDPVPCDLQMTNGGSEKFLSWLGASSVRAMDISAYEGAAIIHDLNAPVPANLHNAFDFIFDGGTLEHVFNVPIALQNIMDMLRVNGLFISVTPANNWVGHGFYQFSPELMMRVFSDANGYALQGLKLVPVSNEALPIDVLGLGVADKELRIAPYPTYLMAAARKHRAGGKAAAYQGNFVTKWDMEGKRP